MPTRCITYGEPNVGSATSGLAALSCGRSGRRLVEVAPRKQTVPSLEVGALTAKGSHSPTYGSIVHSPDNRTVIASTLAIP